MTFPNLLQGRRFRLNRGDGGSPEQFKFVCTITTLKLDEKVNYDDAMLNDCDDPTAIAQRISTPSGQTWDITGSGKCDHSRYAILRGDFDSKAARNWQAIVDQTLATGGGVYQGSAFLDTISLGKSENGLVTFDISLKGQGVLLWTPAAA